MSPAKTSKASLIMVYHREPWEEHTVHGKAQWRDHRSPNGIIPTLRNVFRHNDQGLWVAWKKCKDPAQPDFQQDVTVDHNGVHVDVHRVPLTTEQVNLFYYRFSKEALWPVIFAFPGKLEVDESHWRNYVDVNRRFAEAVAARAAPDARIWVHDYNLWLVPGMLRQLLPHATIGFFHHTPFPAADVFAILPWRDQILASLLDCDLVGFHIPRYQENFVDAACNLAGARRIKTADVDDRFLTTGGALTTSRVTSVIEHPAHGQCQLGSFPVGVDVGAIDRIVASFGHRRRADAIRAEIGHRRVILSIERLDYIKGPVQKLLAYEQLLEHAPEYREKVVFVNILTPPADQIAAYRSVRKEVDLIVGRINGRFATLSWTPVRYFYKPLPYEDVLAWYDASSIAWITPLRDGLNLVAKEFVATARDRAMTLILSEFAGAQVELKHVIAANPYAPASMDAALRKALEMPDDEQRERMAAMDKIVRGHDVAAWADEFLTAMTPRHELRRSA
ncbi:MAG: glucosylglycerol-phosphate synthase [Kofleriaceae bacterium]|nr:glucosylglycerol-phosphate synthase [Kofleriaceae bacterium]